jgi:hypothetical protein
MANTRNMTSDDPRGGSAGVPDSQIVALRLQFALQLYDKFLERHGEDHEQTRIVSDYISALEKPRVAV